MVGRETLLITLTTRLLGYFPGINKESLYMLYIYLNEALSVRNMLIDSLIVYFVKRNQVSLLCDQQCFTSQHHMPPLGSCIFFCGEKTHQRCKLDFNFVEKNFFWWCLNCTKYIYRDALIVYHVKRNQISPLYELWHDTPKFMYRAGQWFLFLILLHSKCSILSITDCLYWVRLRSLVFSQFVTLGTAMKE